MHPAASFEARRTDSAASHTPDASASQRQGAQRETAPRPASEGGPTRLPVSPEELARLFEEFSETTRRLQTSHAALERKVSQLRGELAEKNRQLERKKRLESLGLMVAGAAHEIRNPLGSIALFLDSLSQEVRGDGSSRDSLRLIGRIDDAVLHLNGIVENMLAFTATGPGRVEACNLCELVDESLGLLALDVEPLAARVQVNEPDAAPVVPADRDHVRSVLTNVLKNALQAIGEDGKVTIDWSSFRDGPESFRELRVRDTGPGIPPENLEKVLVPFFSDRNGGEGVGLGLAIVHSLMERQGGRVALENAPGGGLVVRLAFREATEEGEEIR